MTDPDAPEDGDPNQEIRLLNTGMQASSGLCERRDAWKGKKKGGALCSTARKIFPPHIAVSRET
jgi:hypothetical protein